MLESTHMTDTIIVDVVSELGSLGQCVITLYHLVIALWYKDTLNTIRYSLALILSLVVQAGRVRECDEFWVCLVSLMGSLWSCVWSAFYDNSVVWTAVGIGMLCYHGTNLYHIIQRKLKPAIPTTTTAAAYDVTTVTTTQCTVIVI